MLIMSIINMTTKKKKPISFMGYYDHPARQYDPNVVGFGNVHQWKAAFQERMGFQEAQQTIGTDDPYEILGVKKTSTKKEIKDAYRQWALHWHPDKWPAEKHDENERKRAEKMFIRGLAAYTLLMK